MQPDPELPEFDPWLRRFWLLAVAVLIPGTVAFLAGRPACRWLRAERARRLVPDQAKEPTSSFRIGSRQRPSRNDPSEH